MKVSTRPGRTLIIVVMAALVLALGGFLLGQRIQSPQQALAEAKPPNRSVLTTAVRAGSLSGGQNVQGDVSWNQLRELSVVTSGLSAVLPLLTSTPRVPGDGLSGGTLIATIADRPLFAMVGPIPLIRDLQFGMSGPDVARFQQGLSDAGFAVTADGYFGSETALALVDLYETVGFDPVFRPRTEVLAKEVRNQEFVTPEGSLTAPMSEFAYVGDGATFVRYEVQLGTTVSGVIASVAAGQPVVRVSVASDVATTLRVGDRASLQGGTIGRRASVIAAVSPPAVTDTGAFQSVIELRSAGLAADAVGREVRVSFEPAESRGLLVPIASILTSSSGDTYVVKVNSEGKQTRVPVQVDQVADGRAQVESSTLQVADDVRVEVNQS